MFKRASFQYITPGSAEAFSSKSNLRRQHAGALSEKEADRVLSSTFSYPLHRQRRKPRILNPFFMYYRRQQLQVDLFEMRELAKENDGVKYLSAAIDGASKRLFVRGLKDKTAASSLKAIKSILKEMKSFPLTFFADKGGEYRNSAVRAFLKSHGITIVHNKSQMKAAIIERAGRSLEKMLYAYMTQNNTRRYIDVLQQLVHSYNTRVHSSLNGMTPMEADLPENRHRLISALGEKYADAVRARDRKRKTFQVNDVVRIEKERTKFTRSYNEQFSRELFRIVKIERRMPIETYNLMSLTDGEVLDGSWYASELALVTI